MGIEKTNNGKKTKPRSLLELRPRSFWKLSENILREIFRAKEMEERKKV